MSVDFEDISRSITNLIEAGALVVLLPSLLVVALLTGPFARRWATSRWLAALALGSVAGIVAVTLRERDLVLWSQSIGSDIYCTDCNRFSWITDADLWAGATQIGSGWLLNLALFVPAGLLLALATRRPRRVLVGLIVLSALIETLQGLTFLGAPDPADLVANALGALVGVTLGAGAMAVSPRLHAGASDQALSRRDIAMRLVVAVAVAAIGWAGLQAGANARGDALRDELQSAFAGTTASDVAATLATAGGFDEMLRATTTWPMYLGQVGDTDQFEARYTTQFFGLYRCVTIRWTTAGFSLRPGSDDTCTQFRDRPPPL